MSKNNIDDRECDRRRAYAWAPGTMAMVHDPGKHGGARDVTHARMGRVIRMEKDVAVFEALRDRRSIIFKSKNLTV